MPAVRRREELSVKKSAGRKARAMTTQLRDDEAAGRPAQAAAIKQAMAHEGRAPVQSPGQARSGVPAPLWVLIAVPVAALLAWMYFS
jgi:hypothetical protein